jgi:hypothetical protein
MNRSKVLPVFAIALCSTGARASDLNLFGLYVGASAGPASGTYTASGGSQEHDTGWKVMAGVRPLPFLGGEVEYTDFGSAAASWHTAVQQFTGTGRATADGLFAVGYLPIPVIKLDAFAKVGVERVHTTADGQLTCYGVYATCVAGPPPQVHVSGSESDAAYGGGVQLRLRSLALRAEYERASTSFGHPGLLSFGMTWTL